MLEVTYAFLDFVLIAGPVAGVVGLAFILALPFLDWSNKDDS